MGTIKISIVLVLSIFLFIASTDGVQAENTRGVSGKTIKIGMIMDQTGPAAEIGIPYAKGVKNYFRHLNNIGGINGKKIKVILEDDRYSIPMAFAAFKKLIFRDKVLAIMFCGGTGQNTALFKQIEENKVPVITGSWSWTMTNPLRRYVFSPGNDNKDEIRIIMNYIVETLKAKDVKIAIVSPDAEYGKSGIRVAEEKAKQHKVEVVGRETVPIGIIDASSQVLSLRKKKATHVITLTPIGTTLAILRESKRFGYSPIFFDSFHLFSDEVAKIAGSAASNVYGAGAFASWFDDEEGINEMKKVSLKYYPKIEPQNRYYVKAWISSIIAHEGIKRAGNNLSPDGFVNALETIRNFDMKGLTGPINYSSKVHKGNDYARLYKADIEKGYFVPVTDWVRSE
ncbi:MAG: ABC transporter substrate-binding protein [Thermodesulfobacteriota bacterium]|nr:ABC transporter substrate-binding protein [Thermodesulfobacteriota bacterium]